MVSALEHVRVIDFGQYIAGPLLGMLLADQGADVVRVEPPGGPLWDTPANGTWNRGKRSIGLDLKDEGEREVAQRLVMGADVVIENFRPGVMERLGLGPREMTEANPGLVYCSLPGFASDDPRAGIPAWEGVVAAAAATFRPADPATFRSGDAGRAEAGRPVFTAIPIASTYAAFQGAASIVLALNARERDGRGQHIEVPLFDAMFPSIGHHGLRVHEPRPEPATFATVWGGFFECKDGRWLRFGGSGNQNFRQFVEASGIESWDRDGLIELERVLPESAGEVAQIQGWIRELFRTRTAQEWEDLIAEAGSEGAVCRTSEEWFDHPHARESEMVVEVEDRERGRMLQPGVNARMSLTPGRVRGPAPEVNEHRGAVLAELDGQARATGPHTTGLRTTGQPGAQGFLRAALDGVRVLDLCIILAGPTLGRTLAEFGADVIKIDSPTRGSFVARHNDINRGKRSILLDLKSEEGREVFWRLLEDADVVAQNYRAGKLEQLGLGYEEVRKRKPDIVYASLNAYGHLGPWAGRPGHEQFAQTAAGMAERFGGTGAPAVQPNPVNDYGTGYMGAYAVALALLHRQRTGQGQHVDTALAYTAMTLQSPYMQRYEGKEWDEPRGQEALGSGPLHRMYQASDAWVFVGAKESDLPRVGEALGLPGIEELQDAALEQSLEERLLGDTADAWVGRLMEAGAGAQRVITDVRELMEDPWVKGHGLSLTREHEELGLITTCGPAPRLSRTPVRPGNPASKPGSDAREILEEVGLGDEFERLVEAGVIVTDGVRAG